MADKKTRRDFIFVATGAVGTMGVAAAAWPMIASFGPASDATSIGLDIDLSKIAEGEQMKVAWMGEPIFIRHRTADEIRAAQDVDIRGLKHSQTDKSRLRPMPDGAYNPKYLVLIGICTHFGCVPVGEAGDFDGWYCPCHGAHFDTSGRVRKGPAPTNMVVPPYHYASETVITLHPF